MKQEEEKAKAGGGTTQISEQKLPQRWLGFPLSYVYVTQFP